MDKQRIQKRREFWAADTKKPIVSPSVLNANFAQLHEEIKSVAAAPWLHLDLMDGHFVPNLSFGPALIESIRPITSAFFDVHVMSTKQEELLDRIISAGADCITIHPEAGDNIKPLLTKIKNAGCQVGIALCPKTPASTIEEFIDVVDLVLIMTVNPGFGGQKFMEDKLPKISAIRRLIEKSGRDILISVDGGVKINNAPSILAQGADVLVVGSAIFAVEDPAQAVKEFSQLKAIS